MRHLRPDPTGAESGRGFTRREFVEASRTYGFGAATLAAIGLPAGATLLEASAAQAASEEERKARADHVMIFASTGVLGRWPNGPVSQHQSNMTGFVNWKNAIEWHSRGKVYVDVHYGGALGGQIDTARKMQQGTLGGVHSPTQNMAAVAPIWNVPDIPYLIGPVENFWKLCYSREVNDTLRRTSMEQGAIVGMLFPMIRWIELRQGVDRELRLPEHLEGLKIRVTGSKLEQTAFEILPANPTPVAWPEVYNALKDGAVDGIHVGPGPVADVNISEVVGQLTDTEFFYNTDSYWVGTKWYQSLPPALQGAIDEASYQAQVVAHALYDPLLTFQVGIRPDSPEVTTWSDSPATFNFLTEDERAAWHEALSYENNKDVYDPLIDRYGRETYEVVKQVAHAEGEAERTRWWQ